MIPATTKHVNHTSRVRTKRIICTAQICSRDPRGDRRTGRKKCWICSEAREM